jgi:hypothetical protein
LQGRDSSWAVLFDRGWSPIFDVDIIIIIIIVVVVIIFIVVAATSSSGSLAPALPLCLALWFRDMPVMLSYIPHTITKCSISGRFKLLRQCDGSQHWNHAPGAQQGGTLC